MYHSEVSGLGGGRGPFCTTCMGGVCCRLRGWLGPRGTLYGCPLGMLELRGPRTKSHASPRTRFGPAHCSPMRQATTHPWRGGASLGCGLGCCSMSARTAATISRCINSWLRYSLPGGRRHAVNTMRKGGQWRPGSAPSAEALKMRSVQLNLGLLHLSHLEAARARRKLAPR